MVNLSFQQGVFPEALKTARVTPNFKKIMPQFLPITALHLCYQLLVSCMKNACNPDCKYKILFKKQFGFRNNHSSIHALTSLVDSIKNHLDNDYFLCGIFIDIQQAFDTINHDILLAKLAHYRKVDWLIAGRVPF